MFFLFFFFFFFLELGNLLLFICATYRDIGILSHLCNGLYLTNSSLNYMSSNVMEAWSRLVSHVPLCFTKVSNYPHIRILRWILQRRCSRFCLILMFPQDIRDHARFYYCLLTNVSSKKVCKQNKWMRAFGLLYAPRRCLFFHFFLNYVDGKLTENVIAGLVCNGNFSASADTFWKVCLWNTWLSRYCISISRTNFRVRENR